MLRSRGCTNPAPPGRGAPGSHRTRRPPRLFYGLLLPGSLDDLWDTLQNTIPRTDFMKGFQSFERLTHAAQNSARHSPASWACTFKWWSLPRTFATLQMSRAQAEGTLFLSVSHFRGKKKGNFWTLASGIFPICLPIATIFNHCSHFPEKKKENSRENDKAPGSHSPLHSSARGTERVRTADFCRLRVDWDTWQCKNVSTQNT